MKRIWSVVVPLALLAACERPPTWGSDVVVQSQEAATDEESAGVEGATGGIVVNGIYQAPSPGYTLRAYYQRTGDEVKLVVNAHPPQGPDFAVITGKSYRVSIPVPAGTYSVRVVHEDEGTGDPGSRTVTRQRVTVSRN
jgi:hypothetical protein